MAETTVPAESVTSPVRASPTARTPPPRSSAPSTAGTTAARRATEPRAFDGPLSPARFREPHPKGCGAGLNPAPHLEVVDALAVLRQRRHLELAARSRSPPPPRGTRSRCSGPGTTPRSPGLRLPRLVQWKLSTDSPVVDVAPRSCPSPRPGSRTAPCRAPPAVTYTMPSRVGSVDAPIGTLLADLAALDGVGPLVDVVVPVDDQVHLVLGEQRQPGVAHAAVRGVRSTSSTRSGGRRPRRSRSRTARSSPSRSSSHAVCLPSV